MMKKIIPLVFKACKKIKNINDFNKFIIYLKNKHVDLDEDDKINYLFKVMSKCRHYPGDKPPFLENNNVKIFAKRLKAYSKSNLDKEITLLSYGISDGARIFQVIKYAEALGVSIRLIGIDADEKYFHKTKILFPDSELVCFDLFKFNKNNSFFRSLIGKVDFIDISFLLHEIYSFGGINTDSGLINDREGKKKVKVLLKSSFDLLKKTGEIVINDGFIQKDVLDNLTVKLSEKYQKAYNFLVNNYKVVKITPFYKKNSAITINKQVFISALDKITFLIGLRRRAITKNRIKREMKEKLFYYTKDEFINVLSKIGYKISHIHEYNQKIYEKDQKNNIIIIKGKNNLPKPYIMIVGVK